MKNLFILAVLATGFFLNLQETKAQETKAQETKAQIPTSIKDLSKNEQKFVKENCPPCPDGALITTENGKCCCAESDKSGDVKITKCGEAYDKEEMLKSMGIGAVDPCSGAGSDCTPFKILKANIQFVKVIKMAPKMKKALLKQ